MSKRLKLKLPRAITSLQFCRSSKTPSSVITPTVSLYPIPKSSSTSSPSHVGFKGSSESTSDRRFFKRHASKKTQHRSDSPSHSREYLSAKKVAGLPLQAYLRCPSFCDRSEGDNISPVKKTSIKNIGDKNTSRRRRRSLSIDDGSSFIPKSEEIEAVDETDESEEPLSSSYDYSLGSEASNVVKEGINPINNNVQSFSRMGTRLSKMRKGSSSSGITSPARVSLEARIIEESSTSDTGKMRGSVAVVKRSENPYIDFKKSMLDMILEKDMFEGRDLEELLRCFLSVNSRQYHGVIVFVFSEIWEILFCEPLVKRNRRT